MDASNNEIQVGDKIVSKSAWGVKQYYVHRVTKCYAFVKYNDIAEGKFKRQIGRYRLAPVGESIWSSTEYTLIQKAKPNAQS